MSRVVHQRTPLGCNLVSHVSVCWLAGLGKPSRYLAKTISWNACKLSYYIFIFIIKWCAHPPLWTPIRCPLTVTVACQSTAPKCSRILEPAQSAGTVKVRLYHMWAVLASAWKIPTSKGLVLADAVDHAVLEWACTPGRIDSQQSKVFCKLLKVFSKFAENSFFFHKQRTGIVNISGTQCTCCSNINQT